jgi:hypothetical protein
MALVAYLYLKERRRRTTAEAAIAGNMRNSMLQMAEQPGKQELSADHVASRQYELPGDRK